jgi:hypothetical protein
MAEDNLRAVAFVTLDATQMASLGRFALLQR